MKEEFEKLATGGKLTKQQVDALVALTESGYCYHKSWGFGKIANVDTVFARFTIDFQTKKGHAMKPVFAAIEKWAHAWIEMPSSPEKARKAR